MNDQACIFCRIATGTAPAHIVWSDPEFLAFLDTRPISPGHVLLIPRVHISWVEDLAPDAHARLFLHARHLAQPVARAAGAPHTGLAIEGYGMPHAHVHLVPVWRAGDLDPCRQKAATEPELNLAADRLKATIAAAQADA